MTFYTAVGSYKMQTENGRKMPYILRMGRLEPISIPEFFIWSHLLWEVETYDEIRERHTHQIETCSWVPTTLDEVHVFRGLPLLAGAAGLQIKTKPHTAKSVCHYIEYKGVEFFELTEAGETLR